MGTGRARRTTGCRSAADRWDRSARELARYRIDYDITTDAPDSLGPQPATGDQRRDYERAQRARDQLAREFATCSSST